MYVRAVVFRMNVVLDADAGPTQGWLFLFCPLVDGAVFGASLGLGILG